MTKILVPLAPGCEEMEAVSIIDILRRGGIEVITASLDEGAVTASRGVRLVADALLQDAIASDDFDMVVIPGGMGGTEALMDCVPFLDFLKRMSARGCMVGAICAAPMILQRTGLLDGIRFTAYPGVIEEGKIPNALNTGGPLENDHKIMTSRGPGTAIDFALAILEECAGKETRITVEKQLVRS